MMRGTALTLATFFTSLTLIGRLTAADLIQQPRCPNCEHLEFKVDGAPDLIFRITDWSEDNEAHFLRTDARGNQILLMDVIPVARDADGSMQMAYWPRDLASIISRRGRSGLEVWVAFDDSYYDTSEDCHPGWQHRMPMVLFKARGEYSGATQIHAHFSAMSVRTLEEKIRRPPRHPQSRLNCDGPCCVFDQINTLAAEPVPEPPRVDPEWQKAPTWYRGEIVPPPDQ